MRAAFGLIGLLIVVLLVAKLGKTQLESVPAALPPASGAANGGTARERIDAVGQQVQQRVDEAARRASEAQNP